MSEILRNLENREISIMKVFDVFHILNNVEQGKICLLAKKYLPDDVVYIYPNNIYAKMISKHISTKVVDIDEVDITDVCMGRLSELINYVNNVDKRLTYLIQKYVCKPCYIVDQLREKIESLLECYKNETNQSKNIILEDIIPFCIQDFETMMSLSLLHRNIKFTTYLWKELLSNSDNTLEPSDIYRLNAFVSLVKIDRDLLIDCFGIYCNKKIDDRNIDLPYNIDMEIDKELVSDISQELSDENKQGWFSIDFVEKVMKKIFKSDISIDFEILVSDLCYLKLQYKNLSSEFNFPNLPEYYYKLTHENIPYYLFYVVGDKKHIYGIANIPNSDEVKVMQIKKGNKEYTFDEFQ